MQNSSIIETMSLTIGGYMMNSVIARLGIVLAGHDAAPLRIQRQ